VTFSSALFDVNMWSFNECTKATKIQQIRHEIVHVSCLDLRKRCNVILFIL